MSASARGARATAPSRSTSGPLADYFPSKTHQMIITEPLRAHRAHRDLRHRRHHRRRRHHRPGRRPAPRHRPGADRARPRAARPRSRRPASSPATPARRSRRSTASRRPARLRSTPSASPSPFPLRVAWLGVLKFGTDGVRGRRQPRAHPGARPRPRAGGRRVLGRIAVRRRPRHPRVGPLLEAAFVAGLAAEGAHVIPLGVAPTPAVAWLAAADGVPGAVISASHNPFDDNGIKLFAAGGRKLPDEVETALEAELHALLSHEAAGPARTGDAVGTVTDGSADVSRWADSVARLARGPRPRRAAGRGRLRQRRGLRPSLRRSCGRSAPPSTCIHAEPDGTNINAGCGSTHPDDLQRAVVTARRRRRARLRRRRRPRPRRRRRRARWSTATRSSPSPPSTGTPTGAWPRTPSWSP